MPGSLFVVATPIGNLDDLTFRALRTLKDVDVIAAEDTRRTSRLLAHYDVRTPLVSLHEHNEYRDAPKLVARIRDGASVALVSDAGTPAISDPGAILVRLCREAGLPVVPIPGPSAITAALSVSGLPATPFTFVGFPPATGSARSRWFEALNDMPNVVVFFEAPHRIERTLSDLHELVNRPVQQHREITKMNESFGEQPTESALDKAPKNQRGEFVVILGPLPDSSAGESTYSDQEVLDLFNRLTTGGGLAEDDALSAAASVVGVAPWRVKKAIKKARILAKRQNG